LLSFPPYVKPLVATDRVSRTTAKDRSQPTYPTPMRKAAGMRIPGK
jgi:hypothetical protein